MTLQTALMPNPVLTGWLFKKKCYLRDFKRSHLPQELLKPLGLLLQKTQHQKSISIIKDNKMNGPQDTQAGGPSVAPS